MKYDQYKLIIRKDKRDQIFIINNCKDPVEAITFIISNLGLKNYSFKPIVTSKNCCILNYDI